MGTLTYIVGYKFYKFFNTIQHGFYWPYAVVLHISLDYNASKRSKGKRIFLPRQGFRTISIWSNLSFSTIINLGTKDFSRLSILKMHMYNARFIWLRVFIRSCNHPRICVSVTKNSFIHAIVSFPPSKPNSRGNLHFCVRCQKA